MIKKSLVIFRRGMSKTTTFPFGLPLPLQARKPRKDLHPPQRLNDPFGIIQLCNNIETAGRNSCILERPLVRIPRSGTYSLLIKFCPFKSARAIPFFLQGNEQVVLLQKPVIPHHRQVLDLI